MAKPATIPMPGTSNSVTINVTPPPIRLPVINFPAIENANWLFIILHSFRFPDTKQLLEANASDISHSISSEIFSKASSISTSTLHESFCNLSFICDTNHFPSFANPFSLFNKSSNSVDVRITPSWEIVFDTSLRASSKIELIRRFNADCGFLMSLIKFFNSSSCSFNESIVP